ncbi:cytochrome D1 domain-containing protein [Hydrogenimonas urashimensis]|uniref:cytochrome D1 domain-containing protein n=1 Tax=Hydrogenimonas urashimensis TaxID=2740515 RepID=UPI0019150B91|nr:cytochrome D1 domain-containing protein [Hydrogenimonas urashimensis]
MKRVVHLIVTSLLFAAATVTAGEKIFVVERENSALAVIKHNLVWDEIKNMHNFNHAVVKFRDNDGYVITRDGYVIKFDPINDKKVKEYKTSESAIGFIVGDNYVAVANYDNKTVEILDRDLNPLQTIKTGSRNVGIKEYGDKLIFACMDSDEIWVMHDENAGKKKPHFVLEKKVTNIGKVPFDAMIDKNLYVVGLFNSPDIGVLNLDTMEYRKVPLKLGKKERILKVPHFGFWSISGDYFFIPAVGNRKVFVFDHKFNPITSIDVKGNPVFTALSPDKKWLAVSFSGKDFPYVQIIDAKTFEIARTLKFPGWILHLRWSNDTPHLYFSVNTKDEVLAYNVSDPDPKKWWKHYMWPVPKPSGIFLFEAPDEPAPKIRKVSH